MNIYIFQDGIETGPFTKDEIFSKLSKKELDLQTFARNEQDTEWRTVNDVINNRLALFSIEQIETAQVESPRPVVVPDFLPIRTQQESPVRKKPAYLAVAAGAFCLLGAIWIFVSFFNKRDSVKNADPAPSVAETASLDAPQPTPSISSEPVGVKPTDQASESIAINKPVATPIPQVPSTRTGIVAAAIPEAQPPPATVLAPEQPDPVPPTSSPVKADKVASTPPVSTNEVGVASDAPPVATAPTPTPKTADTTAKAPKPSPQPTATPALSSSVSDFFKIESLEMIRRPPKDGIAVWKAPVIKGKKGTPNFRPCLEVKVSVTENIRSDKTFSKAYFYGEDNKLRVASDKPSPSGGGGKSLYSVPVIFAKGKENRFFFEIPEKVENTNWKAVIVFGDKNEAQVTTYPATTSAFLLDYPEKKIVEDRSSKRIARKPDMDPLIEHVVRTNNPRMPQITLFLRPPKGITNASEVKGVMAICVLAGSVEEMKRELQKDEMPGDYAGLFSFANQHKFAILAWGSRGLWDPGRNYDELSRERAKEIDTSFDLVSAAWARGVKELGDKYGIPQKNFLLWGNCGSAQFAARLCLRKPEYFLAVHIHMPGSYDKPTPEAAKVMWCLTIGELEGGYERSKRWVKTVREMGYPIVYKAIPGLGHHGHPNAAALGFEFYKFALLQKDKREALDAELAKRLSFTTSAENPPQPWPEEFRSPFNYGDIVNQELFPPDQIDMIPNGFRISIPTKAMANIWARNK